MQGFLAWLRTGAMPWATYRTHTCPSLGARGPLSRPPRQVCIAPEGTCGDGRGLLEFRTGAFVLGRPVLPVCLKYGQGDHNPAWGQVRGGPAGAAERIFAGWMVARRVQPHSQER
jgi:hypothetical protein